MLSSVKSLCEILETNYSLSEYSGKHPMSRLNIWGKQLAVYLQQFGDAFTKFIPKEIKNLPSSRLRILLDVMLSGDGWRHHRGHRYYTVSERLADDVQEIALKCGFRAIKSKKGYGFVVSISPNPNIHVNHQKVTDGFIDYNGHVFCVNVGGDGIVFVRRNGRPLWCGNTPDTDIPEGFFDIEYRGRKASLMFPRQPGSFYHACYDDQTEVLTDNGWKYFSEVEPTDLLATLNLSSREMQFQRSTGLHRYHHEGLMLHQKQRRVDICVTPNHRVLFFWSHRYPKLQFREASQVKGKPISEVIAAPWEEGVEQDYFVLPACEYSQNYKGGMVKLERRIAIKNWLPFLGWYLSEGSVDHSPIGKDVSYFVSSIACFRI